MYRSTLALLLVFFLMLIVVMLTSESLLVIQRIAHVSAVQGTVDYRDKPASPWQTLREGMLVRAGSQVRTGPSASLILTWADGTKVKVGADTLLSVEKCFAKSGTDQEVSLFRLHHGRVWTRIAKRLGEQSEFEVATPGAVAGVRGTIFSVEARETKGKTESVVSVHEGHVQLTTPSSARLVSSGRVAVVSAAGDLRVRDQLPGEVGQWLANQDLLLPSLEVTSPREGEAVSSDRISVVGRAEPEATVTINGVPTAIDSCGRFRTQHKLSPGQNRIRVTAEDVAHRVRACELSVVLKPRD